MKRAVLLMVLAALLTGCGHNFGINAKGIGLRAAWNPDSLMPEISLGYYEVGSVAVRENAEAVYKSSSLGSLAGGTAGELANGNVGTELSVKTAEQVNGYTVKLDRGQTEK